MSRESLHRLMELRSQLEAEIEQHGTVLRANKIGMHERLTDSEGFPRTDVDVMAVRTARHSIICLQNDRKVIMAEIEKEMALCFELQRNATPSTVQEQAPPEPMELDEAEVKPPLQPFVLVEKVERGLLADRMGIQNRDKILQIGTLSSVNFKSMNQIQAMIQNARGGKLPFVVRKANTGKDVTVEADLTGSDIRFGVLLKLLNT
uniref:Nas2 N-terminal domain-containing protein n=1 Tax=Anopheles culicifacies TaxID=139723 RepID=A0A182M6S3_9DIPT